MSEFIHPRRTSHTEKEFERFKGKHRKTYNTDHEHEHRHHIFMQNLRLIHSKNRANLGYTLAVNHLTDRTEEELKALRGFKSSNVYNGMELNYF